MKITALELRSIIKEEVEKEKLRRIVREAVRQEMINEGFLDKVKGMFGGGIIKDFASLMKGISELPMHYSGVKPNKENPKIAADFLAAMIGDGLDVQIPGKKGKGFWLGTLFDGDGNLKEKDLTTKLLDLQSQYKNKKLNDDKFEKEVVKLVGFPRARWSEFASFAKELITAAKEQEEKAKRESEDKLEQGKKERESAKKQKEDEKRDAERAEYERATRNRRASDAQRDREARERDIEYRMRPKEDDAFMNKATGGMRY